MTRASRCFWGSYSGFLVVFCGHSLGGEIPFHQHEPPLLAYPLADFPLSVTGTMDLNCDSYIDLVACGAGALPAGGGGMDFLAWFKSDGGSPPSFMHGLIGLTRKGPASAAIVDVNLDGKPDIVVGFTGIGGQNPQPGELAWFENNANCGQVPPIDPTFAGEHALVSECKCLAVGAGDIDGDGDDDVVASFQTGGQNRLAWYPAQLTPPAEHVIASDIFGDSYFLLVADVDGGANDVIVSFGNTIEWFRNQGGGTFDPGGPEIITQEAIGVLGIHAGDIDGDGDTDVVSASQGDGKVAWFEQGGMCDPPAPWCERILYKLELPDQLFTKNAKSVMAGEGDINFGEGVTGLDAALIKPHFGEIAGVDLAGPQFDYDCSGGVTGGDYSLVKTRLGNVAPACP